MKGKIMLIQVIYGIHLESDFTCRRCAGAGREPGAGTTCLFCAGGPLPFPRAYTYSAPDDALPALWSNVLVPVPSGSQVATVIGHGSDYTGPVKAVIMQYDRPAPPVPPEPLIEGLTESYAPLGEIEA